MKTINYGIIGCGLIADFHARAVLELEETKPVKLYGVVDVRKEAADKFAEKFGGLKKKELLKIASSKVKRSKKQ